MINQNKIVKEKIIKAFESGVIDSVGWGGNDVEISEEFVLKFHDKFAWNIIAKNLLSSSTYEKYWKIVEPIRDEFWRNGRKLQLKHSRVLSSFSFDNSNNYFESGTTRHGLEYFVKTETNPVSMDFLKELKPIKEKANKESALVFVQLYLWEKSTIKKLPLIDFYRR